MKFENAKYDWSIAISNVFDVQNNVICTLY